LLTGMLEGSGGAGFTIWRDSLGLRHGGRGQANK
jgi:hypothetical protein